MGWVGFFGVFFVGLVVLIDFGMFVINKIIIMCGVVDLQLFGCMAFLVISRSICGLGFVVIGIFIEIFFMFV